MTQKLRTGIVVRRYHVRCGIEFCGNHVICINEDRDMPRREYIDTLRKRGWHNTKAHGWICNRHQKVGREWK